MAKSRWTTKEYKDFKVGDIICNADKQDFERLIVKIDECSIWCAGFVHAALTENDEKHPVFPMRFVDIENGYYGTLLRLGNLNDYQEYITRVEGECTYRHSV